MNQLTRYPIIAVIICIIHGSLLTSATADDPHTFLLQSDLFQDQYTQDLKDANQSAQRFVQDNQVDRTMALWAAARAARLQGSYIQANALLEKALENKELDPLAKIRLYIEYRIMHLEQFSPYFGGYNALSADIKCKNPELQFEAIQLDKLLQALTSSLTPKGKPPEFWRREQEEVRHHLRGRQWGEASFIFRELSQHVVIPSSQRPPVIAGLNVLLKSYPVDSAADVQAGWLTAVQRRTLEQRRLWPLLGLLSEDAGRQTIPPICSMPANGLWAGDGLTALSCAERQLFPLGSADDLGLFVEAPQYEWVTAQHFRQSWQARQPPLTARLQAAQPLLAAAQSLLSTAGIRRAQARLWYLQAMAKLATALAGKLPDADLHALSTELEQVATAASAVGDRRFVRQIVAMGALTQSLYSPTAAGVNWLDQLIKMSIADGDYGQLLGWGRVFAEAAAVQAFTTFRPEAADVLYAISIRFYEAAGASIEASKAIQRWAEMLRSAGAVSRALDVIGQGLTLLSTSQTTCKLQSPLLGDLVIQRASLLSDASSVVSELGLATELRPRVAAQRAYAAELLSAPEAEPLLSAERTKLPPTLLAADPLLNKSIELLLAARTASTKQAKLVAEAQAAAATPGPGQAAAAQRWRQLFDQRSRLNEHLLAVEQAAALAIYAHFHDLRLKQLDYQTSIHESEDDVSDICDNPKSVRKNELQEKTTTLVQIEHMRMLLDPYEEIIFNHKRSIATTQADVSDMGFLHKRRERGFQITNLRMLIERKQFAEAHDLLRKIEREHGSAWYSLDTHEPWSGLELYSKLQTGLFAQRRATSQQVLAAAQQMVESYERRRIATVDERMRALLAQQPQGGSIQATAVDAASSVGDVHATLDHIERAKAKAIQERVLGDNNAIAVPAVNLGSALNMLDVQLVRTGCTQEGGDVARCSALQERKKSLLQQYEELRQRTPLLAAAAPPALSDIQAALPAKSAVLDYFVSDGTITAVLLTKDSAKVAFRRSVSLPYLKRVVRRVRDRLDLKVDVPSCELTWLAALTLPTDADLTRLQQAGIAHLIIVPHGPLHDLPFVALPVSGRHLVERFVVREIPYAGLLRHSNPPPAPNSTIAILYYDGDPESGRTASAKEEAEQVAAFNGKSQAQQVQTRQHFLSALRDYAGVYFVGHAIGSKDNENLFGKIDLPRVSKEDSGDLSVIDILSFSDPLRAKWVFLSACEGARNNYGLGAEGLGVAQALLQKGIHTVIANLVTEKNQTKNGQMLAPLIATLSRGEDPAVALAMMQRAAIKNRSPLHQWASLVAIGGPER